MKKAILWTTLVMAFGVAVGCGDSKKSAAPPASTPGVVTPTTCSAGYVYDTASATCVVSTVDSFQLYDDLTITNGSIWTMFLEDYSNSTNASFWCRNKYYGGNLACSTYDYSRTLTMNLNSLLVDENGATQTTLILTAASNYGNYVVHPIYLPLSVSSTGTLTVNRFGTGGGSDFTPDAGFQVSTTLHGPNGPKQFILRGYSIDMTANEGVEVELFYGDPGQPMSAKYFAKAVLFAY